MIKPQPGSALTQLDRWQQEREARQLKAARVVVSLGGNDAGFATIGAMCLAPGNCDEQSHLWLDSLPQVAERLRLAYLEIRETFPGAPVYTVGYPDPIALTNENCTDVSLTVGERRFVHTFVLKLNQLVRQTSEEFGFHYVHGMESALSVQHKQLCDQDNQGAPGLNFINLRSVRGDALHRFNPANWYHNTLHPNASGHEALGRAFTAWYDSSEPAARDIAQAEIGEAARSRLKSQLSAWAGLPKDATRKAQVEQEQLEIGPACNVFDDTKKGCKVQGTDWALLQVSALLLVHSGALLLILGCAGAWAGAVAVLAGLRRRHANSVRG